MKKAKCDSAVIQPEDIRRKADNLYPKVLSAWLHGDDFFPHVIPAQRMPGDETIATAVVAIQRLRDGSKQSRGFGYSVEWREINSHKFGRNQFPARIFFETREDFLRFIGKQREFAEFSGTVAEVRAAFPRLESWIRSNSKALIEAAPDVAGLLQVVQYFSDHPRPNVFARELPLDVDTKFIERQKPLLRKWLDLVLPPHAIRADEDHFERRYGLRYIDPLWYVRLLDAELADLWHFPCTELAIPMHTLGELPLTPDIVFIVENKVNLFTLPAAKRAIALGGLGNAVVLKRYLPWLQRVPIVYWGDLDVEGLEILSSLRSFFPQTRSLLMDVATLDRFENLAIHHAGGQPDVPLHLTDAEQAAYVRCRDAELRLEQERIPQSEVLRQFSAFGKAQSFAERHVELP
jgi:hypothetical protein